MKKIYRLGAIAPLVPLLTACGSGFKAGYILDQQISMASSTSQLSLLVKNGAQFKFTTAAQTATTGKCSGVATVALQTATGAAANFQGSVGVPLSGSSSSVSFYSDSGCSIATTTLLLSGNTGSGSFYFKSTAAGSIRVTANLLNLITTSQTETISASAPAPSPTPTATPSPTPTPTPTPTVTPKPSPTPTATPTPTPTVTPKPTPTPTPTQAPPTVGDYPSAATTGPAAGTVFKSFSGEYKVTQNGAVVDGLRGAGTITVHANNVTIQNCDVDGTGQLWAISTDDGFSGTIVKNCRIHANPLASDYSTHAFDGVVGADEVAFCDISGVENSVDVGTTPSAYIHDNYMHDFADWIEHDNHDDGVQTYGLAGTGGLRIIHNTIVGIETGGSFTPTNWQGSSSAIALIEGQHDLTIDNNLLYGGSYTVYGPSQAGSAPANVHFTNNKFSTKYYPTCGAYGTNSGFNANAPGFVWTGNVILETGQVVQPEP